MYKTHGCVCHVFWPNGDGVYNVVSCVDHVALDVVIVVICVCCDDCVHGKLLEVKW